MWCRSGKAAAQGLHGLRAVRQVGDKVGVHDIHVQHVAAGAEHLPDILLQVQRVGCQDGCGQLNHSDPSMSV